MKRTPEVGLGSVNTLVAGTELRPFDPFEPEVPRNSRPTAVDEKGT